MMTGLEVLTAKECWQLLAAHGVGRIAYTENAMPTIGPVGYGVVDRHLVMRCRNARTAAQLHGQVVALEIDDVDLGGSRSVVVVTGVATQLLATHDQHEDESGCPTRCEHRSAVRLEPGRVVGHRLHDVA